MAAIPHFGQAVHAVLPYMKHHPRSAYNDAQDYLSKYLANLPDMPTSQQTFERIVERVLHAWHTVMRLTAHANNCWSEPVLQNKITPDLVMCLPERILRVIEVKTAFFTYGPHIDDPAKTQSWAEKVTCYCKELGTCYPTYRIQGFILVFDSEEHQPDQPLWLELTADNKASKALIAPL